MVAETVEQKPAELPRLQIVERVGSLPVVMTAVEQLGALYGYTKQSNSFVKFGLETAETGLKMTTAIATPVVNKFEGPVSKIDSFAVGQLEKIEDRLPILTKPTPQVMQEAGHLYNATVKPTVDRVAAATKYGVDSYNGVKDFGANTVTGVKTYTSKSIDGVKTYTTMGIDGVKVRVQGAATYSTDTVRAIGQSGVDTLGHVAQVNRNGAQMVSEYGKAKVAGMTAYSGEKLGQLMGTAYGQAITHRLDTVLDGTEKYMEMYLPGEEEAAAEEGGEQKKGDDTTDAAPAPSNPLVRASSLSSKAGRRLYSRSMDKMHKLVMRSTDTVNRLNFTIDLMDYAKTHLDSSKKAVQNGLVTSKDKVWSVWEQVNQSEEEALKTAASPDKMTLESRLIATARHLTTNMKLTFDTLTTSTTRLMPATLQTSIASARTSIDQLYTSFALMKSLNEVQTATLTNARTLVASVQTVSASVLEFVVNYVPVLKPIAAKALDNPSIEMEEIPTEPPTKENPEQSKMETPKEDPEQSKMETPKEEPKAPEEKPEENQEGKKKRKEKKQPQEKKELNEN